MGHQEVCQDLDSNKGRETFDLVHMNLNHQTYQRLTMIILWLCYGYPSLKLQCSTLLLSVIIKWILIISLLLLD